MASFGPTGLPNSEHAHRINRGTLTFSYTCAGLTGTALLFVILFFCYKSRNRAPVAAAVAAAAETGTEGRRCVDLSKLPEYAYTLSARHGGSGDGAQCSVCLGTLQAGEMMRMLPLCKHLYHVECIDIWLVSHDTCPLCRSEVEPPEEDGKPATTTELPV
ncbi:RING-H2 finger protein ATL39-like [Lolium perenne]|uniref:RING-H2 finger protein ATL39-like n=1 Tax=Lolium perenne TaxID=4522 RepID=UPI0021EA1D1E|nr:RING-H2 finger protein ATL39-like [Lolium perenne]